MTEQLIPPRTQLMVMLADQPNSPTYTSTLVGYGRYGLQLTLPQLLTATYSLPVQAQVACLFVPPGTHELLSFKSYVMGYERSVPPLMIVAPPETVEPYTRRAAKRYQTQQPVGYLAQLPKDIVGEQTVTVDISMGGLRMRTRGPLPEGVALSLTLSLPDEMLLLSGSVAWSSFRGRSCMTGVRFNPMKPHDEAMLAKFLNQVEREHAGVRA